MEKSKLECSNEKNLLIIGASSALGVSFISTYGNEFSTIFAHSNEHKHSLDALANMHPNIRVISADLATIEGVSSLISQVESADRPVTSIAFLAAPRLQLKRFSKLEWPDFERHINIQSRAAFEIMKAFLPIMASRKCGKIAFALSSVIDGKPPQGMADYTVGKYTMLGLVKAAAVEYAGKGICINAVSPSMMETKFVESIPSTIIEQNAESHPRGRNASPEDIIPTLHFLLSKESDFVTGQNIVATGGA